MGIRIPCNKGLGSFCSISAQGSFGGGITQPAWREGVAEAKLERIHYDLYSFGPRYAAIL